MIWNDYSLLFYYYIICCWDVKSNYSLIFYNVLKSDVIEEDEVNEEFIKYDEYYIES
jgi:hypothetical protein